MSGLMKLKEAAVSLGWSDIISRQNRKGVIVGWLGKPKGYSGPHVRITEDRLSFKYCPPSHCVSYKEAK